MSMKQTIRLQSRGARQGNSGSVVRKTKCRCSKSAEVHVAAEIKFENLRLRRTQLNQVQIAPHFESVLAANDADIVREFKPALDAVHSGVWFPPKVGESRNIYADIGAAWKL